MNLNGDYAAIFNNLLLGETPPVEVRFVGFVCLISTQGNMMTVNQKEPVVSCDQTSVLCSLARSPVGKQDEGEI